MFLRSSQARQTFLYVCCTALDNLEATTCPRLHHWGKHHRRPRDGEGATSKCVDEAINPLYPD